MHGDPVYIERFLKLGIALVLLLLMPYMLPIVTPDLGSYVTEIGDYSYGIRLDFLSWAGFKFLGISQEYELRWLAFFTLVSSVVIVWYRRNVTLAAVFLISQFPVLPMIIGSQIRLCLAVQCFMLILVFAPRHRFIFIVPGFFHSSFWLLIALPALPALIFFSDYFLSYISFIGGIEAKLYAYAGAQDVRSLLSGIDLLFCMLIVFVSARARNQKYPVFLGVILIILSLFPDTGLPWVVLRRLTELYLVIYSPLYFLMRHANHKNVTWRLYSLLHCSSYVALFMINYLKYGLSLSRFNLLL